jgi:hypothetical protein
MGHAQLCRDATCSQARHVWERVYCINERMRLVGPHPEVDLIDGTTDI